MIEHIFLDMDGVLVNFFTAALRVHQSDHLAYDWPPGEWHIEKVIGITAERFWAKIDEDEHFWAKLQPYPEWRQLLSSCQSYRETTILSTPSLHPHSAGGKVRWIRDQLGQGFQEFFLGKHKHLIARPTYLLIDDSDRNVEAWQNAGGQALLYPQPWNSRHSEYGMGVQSFLEELDELLSDD